MNLEHQYKMYIQDKLLISLDSLMKDIECISKLKVPPQQPQDVSNQYIKTGGYVEDCGDSEFHTENYQNLDNKNQISYTNTTNKGNAWWFEKGVKFYGCGHDNCNYKTQNSKALGGHSQKKHPKQTVSQQ